MAGARLGAMVDRRCPRDGAALVSDGSHDWCSLVGCTYGLDATVFAPTLHVGEASDAERVEVDQIEGLTVAVRVERAEDIASRTPDPS